SECVTGQPALFVEEGLACEDGGDGFEKSDYGQGKGQWSRLVGALRDDQSSGAEDDQDVHLPTGKRGPNVGGQLVGDGLGENGEQPKRQAGAGTRRGGSIWPPVGRGIPAGTAMAGPAGANVNNQSGPAGLGGALLSEA